MNMKRKRLEAAERRIKGRTEPQVQVKDDWDWTPDVVEVDEDEILECFQLGNPDLPPAFHASAVSEIMSPPHSIVNWVHLALETKWDGTGTPQEKAVAIARGKTLDEIVLDIVGGQEGYEALEKARSNTVADMINWDDEEEMLSGETGVDVPTLRTWIGRAKKILAKENMEWLKDWMVT